MVLGGGARGAGEAALKLGLPIVTTVNGKGVVDERHPLSLGASIRLRCVQRWLETRDTVIAVGTELGESDLWGPPPKLRHLIRIDIDPGQLDKNMPAAERIEGDARGVLEGMSAEPGEHDLTQIKAEIDAEARRDGARWIPLMEVLDDVLGDDGILAADSTQAAYYGAVHFLPMDARRRLLYPTGYATLGYALPAAIGAKLAAPDRRTIALIGDGGLLFTVAELATAAQLGLPLPDPRAQQPRLRRDPRPDARAGDRAGRRRPRPARPAHAGRGAGRHRNPYRRPAQRPRDRADAPRTDGRRNSRLSVGDS